MLLSVLPTWPSCWVVGGHAQNHLPPALLIFEAMVTASSGQMISPPYLVAGDRANDQRRSILTIRMPFSSATLCSILRSSAQHASASLPEIDVSIFLAKPSLAPGVVNVLSKVTQGFRPEEASRHQSRAERSGVSRVALPWVNKFSNTKP